VLAPGCARRNQSMTGPSAAGYSDFGALVWPKAAVYLEQPFDRIVVMT